MIRNLVVATSLVLLGASQATAQFPPGKQGSSNLHVLAHLPLGGWYGTAELELEEELSRPYAYVSRWGPPGGHYGVDIISLKDPSRPQRLYRWAIEQHDLHQGHGAITNVYFKHRGRYYDVQGFQFRGGGPDEDLGAVVIDVTGLPDTTGIREAGRIRTPDTPGGFHNIFAYKHSDGSTLLIATVQSNPRLPHGANVYDMGRFLAGDADHGLIARIPLPEPRGANAGYHDIHLAYDPVTRQDRFYGGGPEVTPTGGYYIYNVTNIREPKLLASVVAAAGQTGAHTFIPTPDGRYLLTASPVERSPMRIFDMQPALSGQSQSVNITRPIGAWAANWQNLPHDFEMRWPYVFASTYEDGLWVVNIMDPTNPYTVGYYDTYDGPGRQTIVPRYAGTPFNGAWSVDVRNSDGLIVIADERTGFWTFKMDGFSGWNGAQWGVPNISSVQDWDNGPAGAPKMQKVS